MTGKYLEFIIFFVCLHRVCFGGVTSPAAYSKELESALRTSLFTNYEILQRPDKSVAVNISLNMLSVNYLDIKEQTLAITAYFTIEWSDSRLDWESDTTYSNIVYLFSDERYVWKPAVVVENSVENIDVISKPNILMRIISSGDVTWTPSGVFKTYCESDVTYWPLDTQRCDIKLSTWAYTDSEVSLSFPDEPFVMDFFQENGEWEIIDLLSSSSTANREKQTFRRLKFTLIFRRRPLFHLLNTLFPVVLMGFLTVIVFKLPPESGERVGLALTILLAYAVYLTLISESIPQTSLSASILSAYLALVLFLQSLSVLLTVLYLDLYFTPEEKPVPTWLKFVASKILARLACVDCRKRTSVVGPEPASNNPDDNEYDNRSSTQSANIENAVIIKEMTMTSEIANHRYGNNSRESMISSPQDDIQEAWADNRDNNTDTRVYSWKEIALMLDKITMYLFLLVITVVTATCMGIIYQRYTTSYSE